METGFKEAGIVDPQVCAAELELGNLSSKPCFPLNVV